MSYIDFWERLDFKFGDWGSKEYFELTIACNFLSGNFYDWIEGMPHKHKSMREVSNEECWENIRFIMDLPRPYSDEDIDEIVESHKPKIKIKKVKFPKLWKFKKLYEDIKNLRIRERTAYLKTLNVEQLLIEVGYYEEIEIQEESQAMAKEKEILYERRND